MINYISNEEIDFLLEETLRVLKENANESQTSEGTPKETKD